MNRDGVTSIPEVKLAEIAAMYGVRPVLWGPVEGGYRNTSYSFTADDGARLNFILYKREPGSEDLVRRTNVLGLHVAKKGLPVRAPVDSRVLKVGERYGSLYSYLPGDTIPWEAYTMKHIKLLGCAMGRFHTVAAGFTGILPDVETVYEDILAKMNTYFSDNQVRSAMFEKLDLRVFLPHFSPLLANAKRLSGRTALHMDLVRSNVLFQTTHAEKGSTLFDRINNISNSILIGDVELSGIIDLEKAAFGHPLFDVARTLAFLLVDCNKPAEKVRKYFLDSGYRKRGGRDLSIVQVDEHSLLEQLITMFLVYDFYKFLRQNPYESLQENHHFIRTERMLRDRKVLQ